MGTRDLVYLLRLVYNVVLVNMMSRPLKAFSIVISIFKPICSQYTRNFLRWSSV